MRQQYPHEPVPMAKAQRLLDAYTQASASTFRPDIRKIVLALNELIGRAQETIFRFKSLGGGMFYYIRIHSGEHDTAKVASTLKQKWPDIDWDIEAFPPKDTSGITDPREKALAELPVYRAFTGQGEIQDIPVTVADDDLMMEIY